MRVQLMLTCLCDALYGEVGIETVRVLRHVGCDVRFDGRQTCCGQPPFNAGDWASARKMAAHTLEVFDREDPIVVPSASCAAMMHEGYRMLGVEPYGQVYELCQFLDRVIGLKEWPALPEPKTVAYHRSCHGRMIGLGDTQERVLGLVPNLTVRTLDEAEQCCGFGGAFSVTHGHTSERIGTQKLDCIGKTGLGVVCGGDMGCLMHLTGLAARQGVRLEAVHVAQVLGAAL